ncbi:hypothetical protein AaE_009960 [Aphanomyces astaci]|uniref:Uncharacterized protein n=1 Tax=Aphanomyces astaci TaxID=112090 RepID=A0A6A5AAU6_APHAT|nr:hypothetical protein AaE_009960 [Aphanomyces astaci]
MPIAFVATSWPVVQNALHQYAVSMFDDITPEMRAFPHHKYAIMGLLDTFYNLLSALPTPHLGYHRILLSIPSRSDKSTLFFFFFQWQPLQRPGPAQPSVQYGVVPDLPQHKVQAMPPLGGNPGAIWRLCQHVAAVHGRLHTQHARSDHRVDSAVHFVAASCRRVQRSCRFFLGAVYKEIALKDVDLDIWYCNAWTSLYQVFLGLLTIWTIRVPALCDPPIDWQDFPEFIGISHQCFLGYPVEFQGKTLPCDEGVFELFMWFILFNMIFSQVRCFPSAFFILRFNLTSTLKLMLYIFKEGSSVLFVVSSAVCLPLTDILYMFPLLTGAQATQTFTIYDGFALFVLVVHNSTVFVQIGLLVYHSEKETRVSKGGSRSVEKSPMLTSPSLQRTHLMRKSKGKVVYHQSPLFRGQSPGRSSDGRPLLRSNSPARRMYGTSAALPSPPRAMRSKKPATKASTDAVV